MIQKDKIRQEELEMPGVNFLRFEALLIVNKVEAVVREIERWIIAFEEKNGADEFVKRKRIAMMNPMSRKRE